jgi:hypothetical protein
LIHNGGRLSEIRLDDCIEAYRAQMGFCSRQHSYWYVLLCKAGFLPPNSPPTVWAASRRGQLTVAELVDGYRIACQPVPHWSRLRKTADGTANGCWLPPMRPAKAKSLPPTASACGVSWFERIAHALAPFMSLRQGAAPAGT